MYHPQGFLSVPQQLSLGYKWMLSGKNQTWFLTDGYNTSLNPMIIKDGTEAQPSRNPVPGKTQLWDPLIISIRQAAQSYILLEKSGRCYIQHSIGGSWKPPQNKEIFPFTPGHGPGSPIGLLKTAPAKLLVQLRVTNARLSRPGFRIPPAVSAGSNPSTSQPAYGTALSPVALCPDLPAFCLPPAIPEVLCWPYLLAVLGQVGSMCLCANLACSWMAQMCLMAHLKHSQACVSNMHSPNCPSGLHSKSTILNWS